jgi:hypothetical protein
MKRERSVRVQYCHAGGDGVSFEGLNFASDDKPARRNARFMLRLVDSLNSRVLTVLPVRTQRSRSWSSMSNVG